MTTAPFQTRTLSQVFWDSLAHADGCNCRWETINAVSQTGGHLGSSLGVVEEKMRREQLWFMLWSRRTVRYCENICNGWLKPWVHLKRLDK